MKHRWWVGYVQWSCLAALTGFAVLNAVTDHGIAMAINCFCLGFVFFSMLMGAWMDRRMKEIDGLFAEMKAAEENAIAAAATFEKAVNNGFVEVIQLIPDERPPTRH